MIKRLFLLLFVLLPRLALADITTALVGYWPLDEGSGTTALNAVVVGANGTLTGGPGYVPGRVGPWAVSTTAASSQYITWGDLAAADFGTGNFTVALWVQGPFPAACALLAKDVNAGTWSGLYLYWDAGFKYYDGTTEYTFTGVANDSAWHHLAVVRTGTGANQTLLYADGVQVAVATDARTLTNAAALRLGSFANDTGFATGTFDDIRLYNRVLTPGDITELVVGKRKPRSVLVY